MNRHCFALVLVVSLWQVLASHAIAQTGTGLTGKYYDASDFTSLKTTRTDATVNFDFGTAIPSGTAITNADTFSIAWSGQVESEFSELYTFFLTADDGARLWVDDQCLVARTFYSAPGELRGQIRLKGGHKTNIRVEYIENTGSAKVKLEWASASQARQVIPTARLYPMTEVPNGGSVMREVWTGIPGSAISSLTSNANYPNKPASREFLSTFECLAQNWEDSFGTRVTGFIRAPISGNYTFAVSGDEVVELYLSTDATAANKSLIASVASATGFRQWDAQPSQQSAVRTLVAGQRYYVELLHKENTGADHWSVGWKKPGDAAFGVIPGTALMMPGTTTPQPSSTNLFNTLATEQPRLGVSRERFIWLKQMWESPNSSQAKTRAQSIINSANSDLNAAPDSGRWGRDRLQRLAVAWWLTGDTRYPEYAWSNIIEYAITSGDWTDPWKGLTNGLVAEGYDWFFPYWTQARKDTMRAKMVSAYQSWTTSYTNNIGIILNSGHMEAMLAVGPLDSGAAAKCTTALGRLNTLLLNWNSNAGAWYEGTDYGILTKWACGQALPALETSLGSTFGLSLQPGLSTAAREPLFIASNTRNRFTFSDIGTGSEAAIGWANWWARRYDALETLDYSRQIGNSALNALYLPETTTSPLDAGLKLDSAFRGPADSSPAYFQEVVTMREKWGDNNATFVGCMGGADGVLAHDSMQSGTFQLVARGKRWFWDLSSDNYSNPGNNSHTPNPNGPDRWDYYRNRAEARNTLVINPGIGPDRVWDSTTRALITNFQSAPSGERSFSVVDMTPKIAGATKVQRGFQLFNKRKQLLVQDEIAMPSASTIWWFANYQNTSTTATISSDAKSVMLTQGTERLWCKILSSSGTWTIRAAEPLPTSPNPSGNTPNPTYSKLTINLTGVTSTTIAVWFVPLAPGEAEPTTLPTITALNTWNLTGSQNEPPNASNGNSNLSGTSPVDVALPSYVTDDWTPTTQMTYAVNTPVGGTVALMPDGVTARFTPTPGFNGIQSFSFTATDGDGAVSNSATITFSSPPVITNWTSTASGSWSAGANWQAGIAPSSNPGSDIRFFSGQTLAAGTITAANDLPGISKLNRLTLAGTGAATTVVSIGGNALNLLPNGATMPEITLSGSTSGFLYQIGSAINLDGSTTFNASGSATFRFDGAIGGSGGITRTGSGGMLILAGDNSYSGSTTINAGTLQIGNDGPTGTLGGGPVAIASGATLRIDRSGLVTVPNQITGAGRVYVHGPANADVVSLTGDSDFTGEVRVESGSLRVTNAGQLGSGTKNIIAAGALSTLRLDGTSQPVILPPDFTIFTSNPNGAILNEAGENEILGNVTLTAGAGSTRIASAAGTLTIAGNVSPNTTGRSLDLRGAGNGVIDGNVSDGSATNVLTGLSKNEIGTWILNGSNAFTGGTTVSAGRLVINGSHTSGNITVSSGATLAGRGALSAPASVSGTLAPGDGVGTMNFGSTLAFGSAGRLQWEIGNNSLTADSVLAAGNVTVTSGAKVDLVFNSPGSTTNFRLSFWRSSRTWNAVSGASLTGAFQIGTLTTDSAGQSVATYGSFSLQHTATGVNLVWTPAPGFPIIDEPLVTFTQPLTNPVALPNVESTLRIAATGAGAGPISYSWTSVGTEETGTGTVTFGNPSAADTTVSISDTGRYILRCTATNSAVSRSADLVVDVGPPENGDFSHAVAVIDPGAAPSAAAGFLANLAGTVSNSASSLWSLVSGPGTVSLSNAANPSSPIVFSQPGDYVLRLTATNALGQAWRDLPIIVAALPPGYEAWQASNWPGVTSANIISPTADPDADGATNAAEFLAGTDPKSNSSVPPFIWNQSLSGVWSDPANWNPAVTPVSNPLTKLELLTGITINGSATSQHNLVNTFTLQRLSLNGTGTGTASLTGGSLSFATGGLIEISNGGITYDISTPLELAAPTTIQGSPSVETRFSGALSGNGTLTKNSTGTVEIAGNHSLAAAVNINAGTLRVTGAGSSSGTFTVKGGTLAIAGNGTIAPATGATLNLGGTAIGTTNYSSSATSRFGAINVGNGNDGAGNCVFNQNNGTILASSVTLNTGFTGGGAGDYNLSGGLLAISGAMTVSNQVAGDNIWSTLAVSGSGTMTVNGGLKLTGAPAAGRHAAGRVTQTDGTVTVAGGLNMARTTTTNTAPRRGEYNLNGGFLNVNQISQDVGNDAFGVFNFNGGNLRATASSNTFMQSLTRANIRSGGARIDTAGFNVSIQQPLLHSDIAGDAAIDGGLTKSGAGKLTLLANNTYTGPTIIVAGAIELSATASLSGTQSWLIHPNALLQVSAQSNFSLTAGRTVTFKLDGSGSGSCGRIEAAGINIAAANVSFDVVAPLNDPAYVLASYTSKTGNSFANVIPPAGYALDYQYHGNQIALVATSGFSGWINDYYSLPDITPSGDPDRDGMDNLLEYVLNGNPAVADSTILPQLETTGENVVFTFNRRESSVADTIQTFEYGYQLNDWNVINITPPAENFIRLGVPSLGQQKVTITIPKSTSNTGKFFGRLRVTRAN